MDLGNLIETNGYWVLALGCLLEGETILALAGFAAHRGYLDLNWVLAIAAACGFAGDEFFFWLGRRYGAALLARAPRIAAQAERVHRLIERHHSWVVVSVRFAYGLRIAGPILIGASKLSPLRFALFNALGAVIWAVLIAGLGWIFGHAIEGMFGEIRRFEAAIVIGVLIVAVAYALIRQARRRSS
ncbi:MAG TPA: DedA family protein [Burkholderiaceae bacterium]|nr:DedA family protein [Burkholderiaceae bacterium]